MAFILKDRVKETSTTTGTGNISLGGAAATFDSFQSYLTNGDTTFYAIAHTSSGVNEWEVGLGTWNTGNTLSRTTVLAGSNGTSAVNFSAGSKDIFMTYPASKVAVAGEDVTFADITVTGTVDGRDVAADGSKLDGIDTSADVTDATTVAAAGALMRSGGTMTGNLILNADPNAALGAATKQYVDTIASAGIHYHAPVRAEHPSNLNATYSNGSSGVGATLTNAGTNAALVIDSVSMVLNDRVLVANQTDQKQNGVYTVTTVGNGSTAWVLTRSTDTDTAAPSDPDAFGKGDAFFIKEGFTNAGHLDVLSTSGTIVFGTTNIVFSEVAETTVYSGGTGITLTGTTFSIGQDVATSANVTFNQVTAAIIGNVTGNLTGDVTGNADTATALETARTIQLSGDVTGSASFDGTANINITAAVQDDSHAHVISNVDGLQSALDAKVPTSRIITAGNGLTGGGDLSANRTLTVGGGSGITVNANDIAIDSSYTGFDSRYVNAAGDTMTGDLLLDASNAEINIKSGITGTSGAVNWTFNTTGTNYASIKLPYNTRGTTGLHIDSGYPITIDATTRIDFDISGTTYATLDTSGLSIGSNDVFHDGYHPNADAWTTARTLSLSGDASGSVSWDGSANATLSVTVANDSHSHSNYITNNANDTSSGTIAFGTGGLDPDSYTSYAGGFGSIADGGGWSARGMFVHGGSAGRAAAITSGSGNIYFGTQDGSNANSMSSWLTVTQSTKVANFAAAPTVGGGAIWYSGNDGSGSGLDADLLDGVHESTFMRKDGNSHLDMNNYNITNVNHFTINDPGPTEGIEWLGGNGWRIVESPNDLTTNSGGNLQFVQSSTRRMTLDTSGNMYLSSNRVFADNYHPNADKWTTSRTLSLSGDASGSVSWDGSANATLSVAVTNDSHTHDGRYYTESEVNTFINRSYVSSHQAGNLAVGWYTIAQNTGDRAVARFALWDINGSDHQAVIFYASHHFGTDASNTLTVLDNSYYVGNPFRYLRIKDAGTYDGAALQVYIDDSTNNVNIAIVGDDVQSNGWDIVDFLADATAPSQVSNWANFGERSRIDLNQIAQGGFATTGPIYADGDTTQYRVFNDNYHPNADKWTTSRTLSLSGDASGSVSWDGSANATLSVTVANDSHSHSNYLTSNADDSLTAAIVVPTANRDEGIFGTYDSYKTQHIWSMGTAYRNASNGANFGNMYGLSYYHPNNGNGTMASSHQTVHCINGSPKVALGSNIWTSGSIIVGGTVDGRDVATDGTKLDGIAANANNYSLPAGPNYIDQATGNYGTVKVDDDRSVSWAGYAIRDDWVFMANGASEAGIYNDTDNEWAIKFIRNAEVELRYNGIMKLETSNDGITVSGNIIVSGTVDGRDVATDGTKLDTIATNANNYVHPTGNGNNHIPSGGSSQQFLKYSSAGTAVWSTPYIKFKDGDGDQIYVYHNHSLKFKDSDTIVTNWQSTSFSNTDWELNLYVNNYSIGHTKIKLGNSNSADDVTGAFLVNDGADGFNWSSSVSVVDFFVDDQIISTGDTDTYMQFHAADQWRVVVGGSERLEVKNSSPHVLVSGDLNSTSDERLKKNIKPIDNALADICQLEGVTFDWRDTGTQGQGFIAQQVEPIIPDVVNTDEDTGMKSINYVGLIGHLVEGIKEQQTQINDLKAEIQSLKS